MATVFALASGPQLSRGGRARRGRLGQDSPGYRAHFPPRFEPRAAKSRSRPSGCRCRTSVGLEFGDLHSVPRSPGPFGPQGSRVQAPAAHRLWRCDTPPGPGAPRVGSLVCLTGHRQRRSRARAPSFGGTTPFGAAAVAAVRATAAFEHRFAITIACGAVDASGHAATLARDHAPTTVGGSEARFGTTCTASAGGLAFTVRAESRGTGPQRSRAGGLSSGMRRM